MGPTRAVTEKWDRRTGLRIADAEAQPKSRPRSVKGARKQGARRAAGGVLCARGPTSVSIGRFWLA